MLEYAPMLHVSYYAKNYAGIIHHGLLGIDWIEDIEVQAFCINFLVELKALRAELIAQM